MHQVDTDGNGVYDSNYDGTWSTGSGQPDWQLTWQWINNFTNRAFPNALYLTENWKNSAGTTVLSKPTINSSGWYTFEDIIEGGYGMGIAWTNTKE